jgi:hypothetical protein
MRVAGLLDEISAGEDVPERRAYLAFHRRRYLLLFDWVNRAIEGLVPRPEPVRLLDIGPSYQTVLFRRLLDGVVADSLGLESYGDPEGDDARHLTFDLNESDQPERWPTETGRYHVVVLAEVLEHLHVAPRHVLALVRSLMAPDGVLILQTPNAVSLHHRVLMAAGRNPYEMIRDSRTNPGHFREYTFGELESLVDEAGLVLDEALLENYFGPRDALTSRIYTSLGSYLPPKLRDGITLSATSHR